jgi:hypothetical protein
MLQLPQPSYIPGARALLKRHLLLDLEERADHLKRNEGLPQQSMFGHSPSTRDAFYAPQDFRIPSRLINGLLHEQPG